MTNEQKVAYVQAQAVCALNETINMFLQNLFAIQQNQPMKYNEEEFTNIPNKYGIHHNSLISLFHSLY